MTEQRLPGGRSFGAVRVGDEVRRARQPWTSTVQTASPAELSAHAAADLKPSGNEVAALPESFWRAAE